MKGEKKKLNLHHQSGYQFFLSPIISRLSLLIFLNLTQNYFLIDLFFSTKKNFFALKKFQPRTVAIIEIFSCVVCFTNSLLFFCFTIILLVRWESRTILRAWSFTKNWKWNLKQHETLKLVETMWKMSLKRENLCVQCERGKNIHS